jgi:hypothetical protein
MTTRPTSARLVARLAVAGALALGLAGGVASVASAAPAPADKGRADVLIPGGPGILTTVPTTPATVPELPVRPDPDPDPCDPRLVSVHRPGDCPPPDPCSKGTRGDLLPDRCRPDPCKPRRGVELPERCKPDPCAGKDDQRRGTIARRDTDPRDCLPPKPCDDPDRCDRPVPGRPSFTG